MKETQEAVVKRLEKELKVARINLEKIDPELPTKVAMGKGLPAHLSSLAEVVAYRQTYQQLRTAGKFL